MFSSKRRTKVYMLLHGTVHKHTVHRGAINAQTECNKITLENCDWNFLFLCEKKREKKTPFKRCTTQRPHSDFSSTSETVLRYYWCTGWQAGSRHMHGVAYVAYVYFLFDFSVFFLFRLGSLVSNGTVSSFRVCTCDAFENINLSRSLLTGQYGLFFAVLPANTFKRI